MRPASVLMLCTGNVCRSPMAEVLLRERLEQEGREVRVESAGIGAPVGLPADPHAIDLMQDRGLDLLNHRARQISREMVSEFDLLMVVEWQQAEWLHRRYRAARGKIWHLGHFDDGDIDDPVGRDLLDFEDAMVGIERGIAQWYPRLWPKPGATGAPTPPVL